MTENGSRGARRCLFGREDPETLSRDLEEQVRQEERSSAEDFERKWNFRIRSETPLEGRYQWEKIGNTRTATSGGGGGLSSLPSSPLTDEPVSVVVKVPIAESSDNEKSSTEEKSTLESSLSSITSKSDVDEASSSSEEKDVNQNLVKEPVKRKAPKVLPIEDKKEAKRAKPP